MPITIENENTLISFFESGVNLFIGSGFSVEAKDKANNKLPAGNALVNEILRKFNLENLTSLNLPQISSILESNNKENFFRFLNNRFSVYQYNDLYNDILKINIKSIITTNIDNLFHKIASHSNDKYINDITITGPSFQDRSAIDYIPLHGCVDHSPNDFVFSILNIAAAFSSDPDKWHFLTERVQKTPTLFWGYSLNDAGVLQSLNTATIKSREHKEKWIVLRTQDDASVSYFKSLGFHIIIAETKDLLSYINEIQIKNSPSSKLSSSSKSLFPEYAIPDLGEIPVRPIEDFFLGSPPSWYDIFSGKLHKISHFYTIKDSICSSMQTVIIGLPACGKTTLMMQLANEINFNGYKLVCNSLTYEQAKIIIKKINNEPALIFVDNFSDDIRVVEVFYKEKNIKFVAFDRFYNFDLISHKIKRKLTDIIEVTDLTDKDIQEIYSRIPDNLKCNRLKRPEIVNDNPPCVFEFIELNISRSDLKSRFKTLLEDLKKKSIEKYYLLLMCCYVHNCRTPVSFDLAYAFLRNDIESYQDVYITIDSLSNLITELSSQIVDFNDQDYYMPRSSFLSETVMGICPNDDLKAMLLKFYQQVSSFRIPRYYIFKRKAYDSGIIGKAFTNWEEGLGFYEKAEERDSSPFLKQQCALYLSYRKRFKEAFNWIDSALIQSNHSIPTIKNSHAIILFRANIDNPHDVTAKSSINQSMDILSECYHSDNRKTYHALVHADHAIQYSSFFNDEKSKEYLATSEKWLCEEIKKSPWNKNCQRMLKKVQQRNV